MKQVETFKGSTSASLDRQINDWLHEYRKFNVISINHSVSRMKSTNFGSETLYTAMIFYHADEDE